MWQMVLQVLFWLCVFALVHSYLLYPWIMCFFANKTQTNVPVSEPLPEVLPFVSVIVAAYNEEKVIAEKLANLLNIQYPKHLVRFYIGSDASSDGTSDICKQTAAAHSEHFSFHAFTARRGKPPVVNELVQIALAHLPAGPNHMLLLTDASVMLRPDCLLQLVKHYADPQVGCVDARMTSDVGNAGIGQSETQYMGRETQLKWCESRAWGMMIGPFGGCYTLRSDLFRPIPPRSLVDDFYLGFGVLTQGYKAINELNAQCIERATQSISEEYRRKRRIATGSMRNLSIFSKYALQPFSKLGFAFVSHKVLRWFGPWLMLLGFCCMLGLAKESAVWQTVLFTICALLLFVLVLYLLHSKKWLKLPFAVHLTYFLAMNLALMHGTILYLKGIKDDIWEPTKR
jgi:cellulose synthase/poly-beta-1,6-N-acetylglucosamine synthase-like glycosyltransferase